MSRLRLASPVPLDSHSGSVSRLSPRALSTTSSCGAVFRHLLGCWWGLLGFSVSGDSVIIGGHSYSDHERLKLFETFVDQFGGRLLRMFAHLDSRDIQRRRDDDLVLARDDFGEVQLGGGVGLSSGAHWPVHSSGYRSGSYATYFIGACDHLVRFQRAWRVMVSVSLRWTFIRLMWPNKSSYAIATSLCRLVPRPTLRGSVRLPPGSLNERESLFLCFESGC